MKLKKGSVKTLFLVLLSHAVICSSNVAVPKSTKIVDVLKDRGEQDVSFNLKGPVRKTLRDSLLPEDISRFTTSFAERNTTVCENQANACRLRRKVIAQMYQAATCEWTVDDNTIQRLHSDVQLLIDCTRPHDRLLFTNKKMIRLTRTLKIMHELEFIGKLRGMSDSGHANSEVPSLTCPFSEPALSVNASNFKATALSIRNCASSYSYSDKAAIVLERGSSATLSRIILKDNRNRAIYIKQQANLVLTQSDLENNSAYNHGGAIYVEEDSTIHIQKSSFKRNFADNASGGVLFVCNNSVLDIKDSKFNDNISGSSGGAIYGDLRNVILIHKSTFSSEIINCAMGTFAFNQTFCVKQYNHVDNKCRHSGGAVDVYESIIVDIARSTFTNNHAIYGRGGAVSASGSCDLRITRSTFAKNSCNIDGGAIRLFSHIQLSIEGSSFTNNTSGSDGGGALSLYDYNALNILETSFTNNTSERDFGGAVRIHNYNSINIKASSFANNLARESGGGMYLKANNTMIAYDSSLANNIATNDGGALQFLNGNHVTCIECTVSGNQATNGGALNLGKDNILSIQRSSISDNVCTSYGSVLYLGSNNVVLGFNSNITNNHARQTAGQYNGAIYSTDSSSSVFFANSIISGNSRSKNWAINHHSSKNETSANSRKGIMV